MKNKNLFPIYGILAGVGLSFVYLKTLGKEKNLDLIKTLLIGGGIGAGLGSISLLLSQEPKAINEESLRKKAKDLGSDVEKEIENYLFLIKKANLSEKDNQRVYNVINGLLLAKKDKKWDEKADILAKKKLLLSYGVKEEDFNVFQDFLVKNIADVLSNLFK
jgi:gas vesicle protein